MTKTIISIFALTLSVGVYLSCSNSAVAQGPAQTDTTTYGEEVSVNTVHAMKEKKGIIVLDIRTPEEFNDEHIPGVVHIPMDEVLQRTDEFLTYEVIFVTCRSGNRSGRVTEALRSQGHMNVHNMAGGIRAWKSAGYSVESAK